MTHLRAGPIAFTLLIAALCMAPQRVFADPALDAQPVGGGPAAVSGELGASSTADPKVDAVPNSAEQAEQIVKGDPTTFGRDLYQAVKSGDYWYAVGLVLCLLTLCLRLATPRVAWLQSSRGGLFAIGAMTCFSFAGVALAGHAAPDLKLFGSALMSALVAMGGYTGLKRAIWPK